MQHKYLHLFRKILVSIPFEAGCIPVMSAWKDVANRNTNIHEDMNYLLFRESGVSTKACMARFKFTMKWCSKYQMIQLSRGGCDDEAQPSELLVLIEEIHKRLEQFK